MDTELQPKPHMGLRAMPRGCGRISSEMIHDLLPVFLVYVLVGLIEGVGEATASICELFSGWLSDKLGKRKALGALSKPLFALAPTSSLLLAARFSDRVGKGIRGAPRDALVGDMVPAGLRGVAYGLRQSRDTGPETDIQTHEMRASERAA